MLELWNAVHTFFVKNGYVFEMYFAISLFVWAFQRRKRFPVRLLLAGLVTIGFSVLWNAFIALFNQSVAYEFISLFIVKFLIFFFLFTVGIFFCFDVSVWGALFCTVGSCASQHCVFKVFSIVMSLCGTAYESDFAAFVNLIVVAVVYPCLYLLFTRNIKRNSEQHFENKKVIAVGLALIMVVFVFQSIMELYVLPENKVVFIIVALYGLICCLFTLGILNGFFRNDMLVHDMAIMEHLMHQQEEKYRMTKESVETINIKCHDMKQQLSQFRDRVDPEVLGELKEAINIYDSALKTGNEVLDIFLAEKSLLCEREGIRFDCIADGTSVSFIAPPDLYSMFGNAIDNAIEAVRCLSEQEKRVISLQVKKQRGMLSVHMENYYSGNPLKYADGLPQTTKGDVRYHGFGMRSIQIIVEKYKGNMAILTEENIFNLNIMIPIPAEN